MNDPLIFSTPLAMPFGTDGNGALDLTAAIVAWSSSSELEDVESRTSTRLPSLTISNTKPAVPSTPAFRPLEDRSKRTGSPRREILERDLAALKEHVGLLQARISEIERRLEA